MRAIAKWICDWFAHHFGYEHVPDVVYQSATVPPVEAPTPAGRYKDLYVRFMDLPIGSNARLFRVLRHPKQGQYATDGEGNYKFSKKDLTRMVEINYELGGQPKSKTVSIGD